MDCERSAVVSLFQGTLFLISAGLYMMGREEFLGFLVVCLALSWVNLLYFSRGHKHMGVYSIMIQKVRPAGLQHGPYLKGQQLNALLSCFPDDSRGHTPLSLCVRRLPVWIFSRYCMLAKFLLIDYRHASGAPAPSHTTISFVHSPTAAVVTLLIEPPVKNTTSVERGRLFGPLSPGEECVKPTYRNISYTTLQLFKFTIGMGDMEFTEHYKYKEVFYVLLIGYIILTYILLLNMLIALMNCTVEKTTMESTSIWQLQVRPHISQLFEGRWDLDETLRVPEGHHHHGYGEEDPLLPQELSSLRGEEKPGLWVRRRPPLVLQVGAATVHLRLSVLYSDFCQHRSKVNLKMQHTLVCRVIITDWKNCFRPGDAVGRARSMDVHERTVFLVNLAPLTTD